MYKIILQRENLITRQLVSPDLCVLLRKFGVMEEVTFKWYIQNNKVAAYAKAFDPDDYYGQGLSLLSLFDGNKPTHLPAYSLVECELILHQFGYLIAQTNNQYQISFAEGWKLPTLFAERMPDVMALAIFQIIKLGRLSVSDINKRLGQLMALG